MSYMDENSIHSAYAAMDAWQRQDMIREYESLKDDAIFEMERASLEQNELIAAHIEQLKEQNKLLKEMYDSAKADAEENKKQAKRNVIFGWVSFAVGTVIGIAGVLFGIFF